VIYLHALDVIRTEQRGHGHSEYLSDFRQSTGSNAVYASFVLLELLERHTKLLCERGLR
jgi:hypothetical protein